MLWLRRTGFVERASSNGLRRTGFVERLPVLKTVIELPLVIHSHTVIHTHHEAG